MQHKKEEILKKGMGSMFDVIAAKQDEWDLQSRLETERDRDEVT